MPQFRWRTSTLRRPARHEREVVAIQQESLPEEIAESRREKATANRLCEATSNIPVFGIGNDMHPDEVVSRPGEAKKELAMLNPSCWPIASNEILRMRSAITCRMRSAGRLLTSGIAPRRVRRGSHNQVAVLVCG
jgi:hypothetical protein